MCATSNDEGGLGRTRSQQTQDLRTWLDLRFKLLLGSTEGDGSHHAASPGSPPCSSAPGAEQTLEDRGEARRVDKLTLNRVIFKLMASMRHQEKSHCLVKWTRLQQQVQDLGDQAVSP
ncbi:uncharacterized protein LOC144009440 isoform X1 [Festucalex cinctus]